MCCFLNALLEYKSFMRSLLEGLQRRNETVKKKDSIAGEGVLRAQDTVPVSQMVYCL